jgi:hypothetical protein
MYAESVDIYGDALAAAPKVALLLSACGAQPGFPMADWAAKRLAQISTA